MVPRIALTPGEPAGIGPELAVKLASCGTPAQLITIADPTLLADTAARLGQSLQLLPFDPQQRPTATAPGTLYIDATPLAATAHPGKLNPANATYVLETLRRASNGCLTQQFDALVTGPVHKGVINQAGISFSGHTEFFAQQADVAQVVMMLVADDLRVALASTHLPLKSVSDALNNDKLQQIISILHRGLQDLFAIKQPRISVCGLNPHAGENGHLGREEIEIITPALDAMRDLGMQITGPLPADTLFTPPQLARCDAVLAMYHDQGLPVLKYKGFGRAVNITLGLPFIRTSVDHGTALDIAGLGKADDGSLKTALEQAIQLAQRKNNNLTAARH
ncbi:MAG: 4-hydroxythreonine-4-phosphate dehydrogenase PdxA [Gammaproteobacteria bacterium]|nr:4-hydroxythreonine-4-phosphate dehydrogenase PdxA [Gammaproteobacteria bacterium]